MKRVSITWKHILCMRPRVWKRNAITLSSILSTATARKLQLFFSLIPLAIARMYICSPTYFRCAKQRHSNAVNHIFKKHLWWSRHGMSTTRSQFAGRPLQGPTRNVCILKTNLNVCVYKPLNLTATQLNYTWWHGGDCVGCCLRHLWWICVRDKKSWKKQ